MNTKEAIKLFYVPYNKLGFDYLCVKHNHLSNDDDYMKIHLFKEHNLFIPLTNWHHWFNLFTVGDSYTSDYRCKICGHEFIMEKEAFKHLLAHGIKQHWDNQ